MFVIYGAVAKIMNKSPLAASQQQKRKIWFRKSSSWIPKVNNKSKSFHISLRFVQSFAMYRGDYVMISFAIAHGECSHYILNMILYPPELPTSVIRKTNIFFSGSMKCRSGSRVGASGSFFDIISWYYFCPDRNMRFPQITRMESELRMSSRIKIFEWLRLRIAINR